MYWNIDYISDETEGGEGGVEEQSEQTSLVSVVLESRRNILKVKYVNISSNSQICKPLIVKHGNLSSNSIIVKHVNMSSNSQTCRLLLRLFQEFVC